MERADIGISEKNCSNVAEILNKLLANEYLLYTKTLNYHWNVVGEDFYPLHLFFEKQYKELFDIIDDVAERARTVGGATIASLKEFHKLSSLDESLFGEGKNAHEMLHQLLRDHEAIIKQIRKDIDTTLSKYADAGTSNFLTDLIEKQEKMAWMLRSFVHKRVAK
jgi:starvation-inducible DNA-binding protein